MTCHQTAQSIMKAADPVAVHMPEVHTPEALFELGMMYATGREVDYDLIAAHKFFNIASIRGNERAREMRAELAGEMSRRELREAQRQARQWLQQH